MKSTRGKAASRAKTPSLIRWIPTAIICWTVAAWFLGDAIHSLTFAAGIVHGKFKIPPNGDDQRFIKWLTNQATGDAFVINGCISAWYQMTKGKFLGAKVFLICAIFIISVQIFAYLRSGAGFERWLNLAVPIPFLFYAIIFAHRQPKKS
jgi:hypothetical protein